MSMLRSSTTMTASASSVLMPVIRHHRFFASAARAPFSTLQTTSIPSSNVLFKPCSRSPFTSHNQPIHIRTFLSATHRLHEASKVSGKPASSSLPHATTNAREELAAIGSTVAKTIAAKGGKGDMDDDAAAITRDISGSNKKHTEGVREDFIYITQAVANNVPKHILNFGLLGALPYLGTSLYTLYLSRQASQVALGLAPNASIEHAVALLDQCTHVQVTYGAVLLSFLGAMHWGMEFAKYGGYQGYARLALGTAPLLVAWPTLAMEPQMALVTQWFGFTLLWWADMKATSAGWTPSWYSQYRFYLSILVGTCILATLTGMNYLGPTTDVVLDKHIQGLHESAVGSSVKYMDTFIKGGVDQARGDGPGGRKKFEAPEGAEFWTEEGDDGYIKIMKVTKDEDEEEEEEGEEGEEGGEGEDGEDKEKSEGDDDDEGEDKEKSEGDDDEGGDDSKAKKKDQEEDNKGDDDDDDSKDKSKDQGDDSDESKDDSESNDHDQDDSKSKDDKSKGGKKDSDSSVQDNSDKGAGGPDDKNPKMKKQVQDTKEKSKK